MAGLVKCCLFGQTRLLHKGAPLLFQAVRTKTGHKAESGPYEFDRELITLLQRDYNFSLTDMKRWWTETKRLDVIEDQRFRLDRFEFLGPDLATSHFIAARGGAVKFVGRDRWFRKDATGNHYVPNRPVPGLYLEAVDASGTALMYEGLANFIELKHLRYLNVSNCAHFDDWGLSRLHILQDTLEFLDLSGCASITERGLGCLHHLHKLEGLRIANMTGLPNKELVTILLEEMLPNCTVFGVDSELINQPLTGHSIESGQSQLDNTGTQPHTLPSGLESEGDFVNNLKNRDVVER